MSGKFPHPNNFIRTKNDKIYEIAKILKMDDQIYLIGKNYNFSSTEFKHLFIHNKETHQENELEIIKLDKILYNLSVCFLETKIYFFHNFNKHI